MNLKKESILAGEKIRTQYSDVLSKIDGTLEKYTTTSDSAALVIETILIFLSIEKMNFTERVHNIDKKLESLKKSYASELEKDSSEANEKMDQMLETAKKYLGKEPAVISENIKTAIEKWEFNKFMEQEDKNDIYFDLQGHVNFFKKNVPALKKSHKPTTNNNTYSSE